MNNCREKQASLKAYLDGELPITERFTMRVHLMRCAKCREASSAMTELSRRLSPGEPEALDPALRSRILASVTYTDSGQPLDVTSNFRKRGYPALVLGGASVVALLLVVVMNNPLSGRLSLAPSDKSAGTAAKSRMDSKVATPAASAPSGAPVDLERDPYDAANVGGVGRRRLWAVTCVGVGGRESLP